MVGMMDRMLRSAVLFGLLALVWAAAAVAAQETRYMVGVTDVSGVTKAIEASGGRVLEAIPLIDVLVAEIPEKALPGLQQNPNVRFIELDPNDAVWTQEDTLVYGVDNINAEVVWGGAENATNVIAGKGGAGAKVAVVDTGIDCGHPDLTPNCVYGVNYVSKGKDPFDDHGHGTHVAGIIAARDNGFGVIGVAPEATLYAVKVLDANGSGSWSTVANGIVWATQNNMDVINMSLGGTSFSQAVADAVKAASNAGVLVVSAAGNSGCCDTVLYPAKLPESMAIAAVDKTDSRASFSSTGPELDVAAPGVSILSTVPTGTCRLCDPSGYKELSGTSMATPHVSGTGALLMSRGFPNLDAWAAINGTAKDLGDPGFDTLFGYGRVDALAAVSGAPPGDVTPPTVAFVFPTDGWVIGSNVVKVTVEASDDQALAVVELWIDGQLVKSSGASPLMYNWQTSKLASGPHTLTARAMDAAGHATAVSITVTKP
jgi:subtilisin family serine protease